MPHIEAKIPVGKTILSLFFFTAIALLGLIDGLNGNRGAWVVFLVFGALADCVRRNAIGARVREGDG